MLQGVHEITTLLEHAIDHTMDTFELYALRTVFSVTPEQTRLITLAHHRGLDLRPAEVVPEDAVLPEAQAPGPVVPEAEDRLRRQIAAVGHAPCYTNRQARVIQHRLAQAEAAAKVRLERADAVRAAFKFVLEGAQRFAPGETSGAGVAAAAIEAAENVAGSVYGTMEALDTLRAAAPLHGELVCRPETFPESRAWEQGREAYLNWETNRVLDNMREVESSVPTIRERKSEPRSSRKSELRSARKSDAHTF